MGLDATAMVGYIASGTTSYFAEFAPILYLMAGILIAFGIMSMLIDLLFFRNRRRENEDFFDDSSVL